MACAARCARRNPGSADGRRKGAIPGGVDWHARYHGRRNRITEARFRTLHLDRRVGLLQRTGGRRVESSNFSFQHRSVFRRTFIVGLSAVFRSHPWQCNSRAWTSLPHVALEPSGPRFTRILADPTSPSRNRFAPRLPVSIMLPSIFVISPYHQTAKSLENEWCGLFWQDDIVRDIHVPG